MPNPPVVGWKSYQNEAKNTVEAKSLAKIENEFKRVHGLAAAGPLGAKPDDTSENSIFALDEKGPNAQFLTSYSGERHPVRISFGDLEKILSKADADAGILAPAVIGARLTPDEKAIAAGPPPPPLDNDQKPSIEFESAESAIQYLKTRYMMQRGFFGGPPADYKQYDNLEARLSELRKASPSEAKRLTTTNVLDNKGPGGVGPNVPTSIQAIAGAPPAAIPAAEQAIADLNAEIKLITEEAVTKRYTQNPALADALMQTVNPDGTLKKIFVLDGANLAENKLLDNVRNNPQVKLAQREHVTLTKAAALDKDIKGLQEAVTAQSTGLRVLAGKTLITPANLNKALPRIAYSSHQAAHLMDAFNEAKTRIQAAAAGANADAANLILGKLSQQIHINYTKLMQGENKFSLDDWNNTFKQTRRELAALNIPSDSLDKLQTDSLKDQMKADTRSLKDKAATTFSAVIGEEMRESLYKQNRSAIQRLKAWASDAYDAELKRQELASYQDFQYVGANPQNQPAAGNRCFAVVTATGEIERPGGELKAGVLKHPSSPFPVTISESKDAQGNKQFGFTTSYTTTAEAEPAYKNLFKAMQSKSGKTAATITFPEPNSVIYRDVVSMLNAAKSERIGIKLDIDAMLANTPPRTPQDFEHVEKIRLLINECNAIHAQRKTEIAALTTAAGATPAARTAEEISDSQAKKHMRAIVDRVEQSLSVVSQDIKQSQARANAIIAVNPGEKIEAIDAKQIPDDLKKAGNHLQSLKDRLKETKDQYWRIQQEYKLTQEVPPPPNANIKQAELKDQLNLLVTAIKQLSYTQERLLTRLNDYKTALQPAGSAEHKQVAANLVNEANVLRNEVKNFIGGEMKGYPLDQKLVSAAVPRGADLFQEATVRAQKDEQKPIAARRYQK